MFDPQETLLAIAREKCTALHGVPAMFDSVFSLPREGLDMTSLRTGIIAGAPVPRHLMEMMYDEFGMREFTSSYGTYFPPFYPLTLRLLFHFHYQQHANFNV